MLRVTKLLTVIFAAVFGSKNPLIEFHISLNPGPAFTMNILCNVWNTNKKALMGRHEIENLLMQILTHKGPTSG